MELALIVKQNKENSGASPSKELQKLKIQLDDRNFEIRKMIEDHAEEKGRLLMDFAKEKTNFQKTVKELRERIISQNQHWSLKVDQMRRQNDAQHKKLTKSFEQRLESQKMILEKAIQVKLQSKLHILSKEMTRTISDQQQVIKQLQSKCQNNMTEANVEKVRSEKQIQQLYQGIIENLKKDSENKIKLANNSLSDQVKLHLQLKQDVRVMVANHVREKIGLDTVICDLKKQIERAEQRISNQSKKVQSMTEILNFKEKKYHEEIKKIKENHQQEIKRLNAENKKKQAQLFDSYKSKLADVQKKFDRLKALHQQKELLWQQRAKAILEHSSRRSSKKEDMNMIENLEVQLIRKDFQLERQKKELKSCKLELENMQQLYGKIFVGGNKGRSKSFKVKRIRIPNISYLNNRSTLDHKTSFNDQKA